MVTWMLLLAKRGVRRPEGLWLTEGRLHSVILYAHHGGSKEENQERRESCSTQAREWWSGQPGREQDRGREKES